MRRGELVTAVPPGDFGKPHPALIIQADSFVEHPTVTVLPLTSDLLDLHLTRVLIEPSPGNALQKPSHVMIDKAITLKRDKLGAPFGALDDRTMLAVTRRLGAFLGVTA